MAETEIIKPFSHPFLSQFLLSPTTLPFSHQDIISLDQELSHYEQVFLDPEVAKSLITKNELLTSFAISKAEASQLTLKEARAVYQLLLTGQKLKTKHKLTQKDHDQLEFFNIAKTFRAMNQSILTLDQLTPQLIQHLHQQLTQGLDIFQDYLADFTPYKSGTWRDNDTIHVGAYLPAPYSQIESGITDLILYLKNNPTITGAAVFHTALYALHPFNNGNKRVCRILEHILLRSLGLNPKNLYSTSYYYHTQKPRYYKYLLYSLERTNLNHFVAFVLEALILSLISVLKTSLEVKRSQFLDRHDLDTTTRIILKPLIKRHELQFKYLARSTKGKLARQTLVNYLQKSIKLGIINRRAIGRTTYYQLNFSAPEQNTFKKWLVFARHHLSFIPPNILYH